MYNDIPFEIKRVYYMYDTKEGVHRGFHAHKFLEQILKNQEEILKRLDIVEEKVNK